MHSDIKIIIMIKIICINILLMCGMFVSFCGCGTGMYFDIYKTIKLEKNMS